MKELPAGHNFFCDDRWTLYLRLCSKGPKLGFPFQIPAPPLQTFGQHLYNSCSALLPQSSISFHRVVVRIKYMNTWKVLGTWKMYNKYHVLYYILHLQLYLFATSSLKMFFLMLNFLCAAHSNLLKKKITMSGLWRCSGSSFLLSNYLLFCYIYCSNSCHNLVSYYDWLSKAAL